MSDDNMRVIRDNIERSEERQREERQTLRRDFERQADLLDAFAMARKVGPVGVIPSAIWILQAGFKAGGMDAVIGVVFGLMLTVIVAVFSPIVGGLAAHTWFRESKVVSSPFAAPVMTLLIDAAYFGWILVLTS